ncbi:MAG: hypothetical protein AAFV53_33080, partial [Myxococcota bacterium]
ARGESHTLSVSQFELCAAEVDGPSIDDALIFDQRTSSTWKDRLWREERVIDGRTIHLSGA